MDFQIVKFMTLQGNKYELRDRHGYHRIFGEDTAHPYIWVDDGVRYYKLRLLPCHKRELKKVIEG